MKKFYSLLAAALLTSVSMFAGEWVKPTLPTPEALDFASTVSVNESEATACYLYNVEYGGFYLGANSWGTRASLSKTAPMAVKIVEFNGKYGILKNGGTYASPDGPTGIWIDGTRANYDQFVFALNGNQFTITCPPVGGEDGFLSCFANTTAANPDLNLTTEAAAAEAGTTLCKTWILTDIEATNTLLSAETLDNYNKELTRYNTAMDLKKAIDEAAAKYPGIDLAAPQKVYEDTNASTEDLVAAQDAVKEAIKKAAEQSASVAAPQDMTSLIVNPTFDSDGSGWSGTGFTAGYGSVEHFNKVFDTYQTLTSIPNGVYAVSVDGFNRVGEFGGDYPIFKSGKPSNSYVYGTNLVAAPEGCDSLKTNMMHLFQGIVANENPFSVGANVVDGEDTYYFPNSMEEFGKYNAAGYYKTNKVLVPVTESQLRLGVQCTNNVTNSWNIFDNFGLTYYGNGADAYQLLVSEYAKGVSLPEGTVATKSVIDEYNAYVSGAKAANYAEYKEFVNGVNAKKGAVDQNVAVWAEYVALADDAKFLIADPAYKEIAVELDEYLTYDYTFNIEDLVLTEEEVKAEIEILKKLYEEAKLLTPPGTDVSTMLKNTDFSKGEDGWTFEGKNNGGALAANASAKCAEGWNNSGFDIYQIVENAPVGVYEIQTQGFYRYLRGDNAWNAYFNEDGTKRADEELESYLKESPASVYMNDNKTPLANVFDYQVAQGELYKSTGDNGTYKDPIDTYWYPNDMADAGRAFDAGLYKVSAFGLVAKAGDPLRIGMKGKSNQGGDSWAIFTRFKLIFQGFDADIIKPELEKALATLDTESLQGSELIEKTAGIKATAEKAYAAGDGETMFNALAEVFSLKSAIDDSKDVFAELLSSLESLEATITDAQGVAADDVVAIAYDLDSEVADAVNSKTYTTEQAQAKIEEIAKVIKKLGIPAAIASATQDEPVDLAIIANPSFENEFNGWVKAGTATTQTQTNTAFSKAGTYYVESWHQAGTFDVSQKLDVADLDLPAGYYMVTATVYSSQAGTYMYLNNDTTVVETSDDALSASDWSVVAYVEKGGAMTIGVKSELDGATWLCMDNFRLSYLGTVYTGIEKVTGVSETNGAKSIFTLDGAKVATMRKGINIVRLGNGKVVKVLKD